MTLPNIRDGRITRRMVALFVVFALVPVTVTLLIAYSGVHDLLVAQRAGFLRYEAAAYGTSLIERLNMADALARSIAPDLAAGRDRLSGLEGYFRSAAMLERHGTRVLFGDPSGLPKNEDLRLLEPRVTSSGPVVVVGDNSQSRPGVWFVLNVPTDDTRRLALELNPDFLWSHDELPYLTDVCVLSAERDPLNCSRALSPVAREALAAGTKTSMGEFSWDDGDDRYLSGYRELFLRARFGAEPWVVIASQPEAYAMAPVHSLGWLVVPPVLLGLLVAALLGLVQVRRALAPLGLLVEATLRIAKRDFSARVTPARDDEFGVLASAFNAMSQTLGRQFSAMQLHSEINGVILSSMDLAQVATIVLKRIGELVRADRYWLLLPHSQSADRFSVFRTGDEVLAERPTLVLTAAERAKLCAATEGATTLPGLAEPHLLVLPIVLGGELGGALALAYDAPRRPDEEELPLLRDLADRVAIALATARRDEELYRRANFDSLTGLPNRLLGTDALARAVASAARERAVLAVLFVDLDGFAAVNDSAGHAAGDRLLAETAGRLHECVRKSDIVMRLGGDEFALVLTEVGKPADAALVARNTIEALSKPYALGDGDVFVSASVGIAIYPNDAASAEELLQHADLAMYKAKQGGRRQFAFFKASMNEEARRRAELAGELRQALQHGQFELYYQPQLDLRTGRIVGAEALIRWHHPTRGLVVPSHFIAFAESSGLIEEMGRWALGEASAQFVAWQREGLELEHVAVNVSASQLHKPGFAQLVAEALRRAEMSITALRLELTESAVLDNTGATAANLAALMEVGATLELDDFGTGYSSLAYLARLPVAAVKLDRAFIRTIQTSAGTQAVVKAAIDMVHALGKSVIAEGVEHGEQLSVLRRLGCDTMQGNFLSPPLPAAELSRFVEARRTQPRAALSG
jgi:diguanylate cyclase (GGDEF)-like protein